MFGTVITAGASFADVLAELAPTINLVVLILAAVLIKRQGGALRMALWNGISSLAQEVSGTKEGVKQQIENGVTERLDSIDQKLDGHGSEIEKLHGKLSSLAVQVQDRGV